MNSIIPYGTYVVIAGMCVITTLLRFSGYWLMSRVPLTPRVAGALEALPGSAVAAVVLPLAINQGLSAMIPIFFTAGLMMLLRQELIALFCGVALAAGLRALGL